MPLLDTQQVADHCGISRRTLEFWRSYGKGPKFLKVGRLVRYAKQDVDAWLLTNLHSNTTDTTEQQY